jgi:small GTP-binding protein
MGCIGSKEKTNNGPAPVAKKAATFAVRLLGDLAVGKSSLLISWAEGKFTGATVASVGDEEHKVKNITVNNETISLDVVDSAGQERYSVITSSQFRRINGFFYCFDLSRPETFKNVSKWIEQVEQYCDAKAPPQLLVGLKSDLDRAVSTEEASAFASSHHMKYIEASSKTSSNVDLVFLTMAQCVVEAAEKEAQDD